MNDYRKELLETLKNEFVATMNADYDFYKNYDIVLTNEQQFVKKSNYDANKIYIVVKFLEATLFYGQIIQPININAVGIQNNVDVCQRLLTEFANKYNLNDDLYLDDNRTVLLKQFFNAPQVTSHFEQVYEGFRTLLYLSGSFLIGENTNSIESVEVENILDEDGNPYKIQFLSAQWSYDIQLDSQAYTGTNNRTKSFAKIGTLSISFTIYLKNDAFCNKILDIAWNKDTGKGNATSFDFTVTFKSKTVIKSMPFYMVNCTNQQNIGEFPPISVTFTN